MSSKKYHRESSGNGLLLTKEQREKNTVDALMRVKDNGLGKNKGNTTSLKQLNNSGFFAQENVKQWNMELVTHAMERLKERKTGRGSFFDNVEDLESEFLGYVALTNKYEVTPTISAMCFYIGCDKETLYAHARNTNSPYSVQCRTMIEYCHLALESGASESKTNSVAYIFQAKNYFNMKDQTDVNVTATQEQKLNNTSTLEALETQVNNEKILEGKVVEES